MLVKIFKMCRLKKIKSKSEKIKWIFLYVCLEFVLEKYLIFFTSVPVSRLMGSTAATANMGHTLNTGMPGLGACAVPDSKPMQFPLAQRRKRRVLFTQAQVSRHAYRQTRDRNTIFGFLATVAWKFEFWILVCATMLWWWAWSRL